MNKVFILREDKNAQALWAFLKQNWKALRWVQDWFRENS